MKARSANLLAVLLIALSACVETPSSGNSDNTFPPHDALERWIAVFDHKFGQIQRLACLSAGRGEGGSYKVPTQEVLDALEQQASPSQNLVPISECFQLNSTFRLIEDPKKTALYLEVDDMGPPSSTPDNEHIHIFATTVRCGVLCGAREFTTVFDEPDGFRFVDGILEIDDQGNQTFQVIEMHW